MYVDYSDYYLRLYNLNIEYNNATDIRKKEIKKEFKESIKDLNYIIGLDFEECFSILLSKDEITAYDVLKYINDKTLKLPIYEIENKRVKNR